MTSRKQASTLVGILFIMATLLASLGLLIVDPILASPNYLALANTNSNIIVLGSLLILLMAGACVGIAVAIYPIFKPYSQTWAVAYVASRTLEAATFLIVAMAWLLLLPLSAEFAQASTPDNSHFQTMGMLLLAFDQTTFTIGAELVFGVNALIVNYVFYQAKLVPNYISIWGFVSGILLLISGTLNLFGIDITSLEFALTMPIAINEMVLAVWLIIKGFHLTPNIPISN
ncbi:MAG: DUF4386 domain-containing protein [Alphaproteobacteria bacterium]|nr:DUF4386 domain-containing protein [Alphaproteobacteria bacterium]